MKILIISEHQDNCLNDSIFNILGGVAPLSAKIDVVVVGYECLGVCRELAGLDGINQVLQFDGAEYANQPDQLIAKLVSSIAQNYTHIFCAASSFGKALIPQIAAHLDVAAITGVSAIRSADEFIRPIYAGRYLEHLKSHDPIKVVSLLVASMPSVKLHARHSSLGEAPIVTLTYVNVSDRKPMEFVCERRTKSRRMPLHTAQIIVSAGRGVNSKENFNALEILADKLDAAVGATRAAVDAGWLSSDKLIGQTAKIVAPEMYIALGISGATQHLAGMKGSRIIIAVNKDSSAPIFKIADYGLVGDLNEVLPRLNQML